MNILTRLRSPEVYEWFNPTMEQPGIPKEKPPERISVPMRTMPERSQPEQVPQQIPEGVPELVPDSVEAMSA